MASQPIMNTYGRLPVTFVKGEGSWLYDSDNKAYLDALCGIGVCGLGHVHPAVTRAIESQSRQLIHTSNLYGIERQQALAEALCGVSGMENIFFSNSGAEANECAIKIARKYGNDKGIINPSIIVMTHAFHGRTLATLSATANTKVHEGFGPLVEGFIRAPFNDAETVSELLKANPNVTAVMLEPIQGEGGLGTPDEGYLKALRKICDEQDVLLILDEIQSGNGRTGQYFAYQHEGILPDVVTTAKGLGNGVPIGACLAQGKAANILQPGNHGSTYGGNPLACAAGHAVVTTIIEEKLCERATKLGDYLRQGFTKALADSGCLTETRGKGLMIGLVIDRDCPQLMALAVEKGMLINVTAGNVVRLLPPLNMTNKDADWLVENLSQLILEFIKA